MIVDDENPQRLNPPDALMSRLAPIRSSLGTRAAARLTKASGRTVRIPSQH
jgi:hypothetical protein